MTYFLASGIIRSLFDQDGFQKKMEAKISKKNQVVGLNNVLEYKNLQQKKFDLSLQSLEIFDGTGSEMYELESK